MSGTAAGQGTGRVEQSSSARCDARGSWNYRVTPCQLLYGLDEVAITLAMGMEGQKQKSAPGVGCCITRIKTKSLIFAVVGEKDGADEQVEPQAATDRNMRMLC